MTLYILTSESLCDTQVLELIFLQNSKIFNISNKIYAKCFQLMRFDDKFLNCWNWFINSKIMTLLHFDLRKPVRRTGFGTHFYRIQKITK